MTARPVSELRRVAATTPNGPLRRPATEYAGDEFAGVWANELPATSVEIILELDGHWDLEIEGDQLRVGAFASGLVAGPVRSRATGAVRLVQISVDPLAIPALLGVPAGALARTAVAADDLLGTEANRLFDHLNDAAEPAGAAEHWAQTRIAAAETECGPRAPADVQWAAALIRASDGALHIEAVAQELGCSRRHLARRFSEWIGVSPSEYRRLVRFERATAALRADPAQPLGRLALDCGYADHAHMDRDFGVLAGSPPSTVAARFA